MLTVEWTAIRPLNGSRHAGFEELCAQLARGEPPPGSRFERKGTPDAGVECYAVLPDGSEWGWQAKFFDVIGDSQWSQLDDSVKKALSTHPRLARYFVCVPVDRPDARIPGRRSAKDRWDTHLKKWSGWSAARGMSVEFVYWGSHELLDRLARPENVGRLRFWFGTRRFDGDWFNARMEEALKTAGPRYTPEVHVELPVASEFEAFGRTPQFIDSLKALAREIREKMRRVEYAEKHPTDPPLEASASALVRLVQRLLADLGALRVQPAGPLLLTELTRQVDEAVSSAQTLEALLVERERMHEEKSAKSGEKRASGHGTTPFRDRHYAVSALARELRNTREAVLHAQSVAGGSLLLLTGEAGTGKTHLLCDIARARVHQGRPTLLLMGQRFLTTEEPWGQALRQLDLPGVSADEFVGALEAAAQAAGCRALVLIDALNEGAGRRLWPSQLSAFLAHLERSPWIGIVLAVRTSYETIVVPEDLRARPVHIAHQGFADHEYDATRAFFVYYGLELPSTPLLAPEFRNPLFLKTLCRSLHLTGQPRLPRGFHGITATFALFLGAINERLALELGFNPKRSLVSEALDAFVKALVVSGQRWLPIARAEHIVNKLLPGRDFERSLYHGLLSEGVLVEEVPWHGEAAPEEVAFIAYERLADHLVAKVLLDTHLKPQRPSSAFAEGGPLAYLADQSRFVAPGLVEALCIQVAERAGDELLTLAPALGKRHGIGTAFRRSLVWRAPDAVFEGTRQLLDKLIRTEQDWNDTLDSLLTVSTLPQHPLNATFLDRRLRRDPMPDRDAWWSTYLHRAWQSHGAVDRLVDWASSVAPTDALDDETVDLCAITLSWMLTTSNRFLRDRATKALVSLLTGRFDGMVKLVERFADVDDPYVAERVYAVAYAVAMRSHDTDGVGRLASCVYARVFAGGAPPAHVLLRDYARGVIERALHLGSTVAVDVKLIRPPYKSVWPHIPSDEEIKPLLPDWSRGSRESRATEWARNRIGASVMHDDFARYVIGTNSPSTNWLSLRIEEPVWQSLGDRVKAFAGALSTKEREAWDAFCTAEETYKRTERGVWFAALKDTRTRVSEAGDEDLGLAVDSGDVATALAFARQARDDALAVLKAAVTTEHSQILEELLLQDALAPRESPPRFDLRIIQRYVLWRVFDLGWTTKRFGAFDRFEIGEHGREASKPERLAKKYQWIAYHEIMALISDHFQYREQYRENEGDRRYEGPWQEHLRNIDPSCTLRSTYGDSKDAGSRPWWAPVAYENWPAAEGGEKWVRQHDDLPALPPLLCAVNPKDGSRWLNLDAFFHWEQQAPADQDPSDAERRELWYICTGYFVRAEQTTAFLEWAETVDFLGRWMPEPADIYKMFLGEFAWSPAWRYLEQPYYGYGGWTRPRQDSPVELLVAAFRYLREASGFDCSVDDSFTLQLPASKLAVGLGLRWSGEGADFVDSAGRMAAFDPTVYALGPKSLLVREDLLREYLARERLALCWAVLGEKQVFRPEPGLGHSRSLVLSGAYVLGRGAPEGFLKRTLDRRSKQRSKLLATKRTP